MSQEKKKKAVPSWSPHPMPGMLEQTGPSAEAREQLIKEGIWKGDAPNRPVAQRGPLPQQPVQSAAESSSPSESDSAYSANESVEVAPTPSLHQKHSEAGLYQASLGHQQPRGASVAPTPTFGGHSASASGVTERRQSDATASVAPTLSTHAEPFEESVAPTPRQRQRDLNAGVAVPPVSARPQRQPDASTPAKPASSRRQPDAHRRAPAGGPNLHFPDESNGVDASVPLPRPRRGSAAVGKVQSARAAKKHEADERVRRTLRVTVHVDQHLHALASLLGLDLNGALSVAIVEHHLYLLHRRTATEG